jgi:hypothetical protein
MRQQEPGLDGPRGPLELIQHLVLVQVGLLDRTLPVRGGETAAQVLDPTQPMNELIRRASNKTGDSPTGGRGQASPVRRGPR